ncbi:hypothetical protein JH26_26430 [Microvirga sp. BSC39]|nr:hypothetical protein JH26_26430 [Microvirga sp. BSC39]
MDLRNGQSDGTMPLNIQFGKGRQLHCREPRAPALWMQIRESGEGSRRFPEDPAEGELSLNFVDTNMRSLVQRIDQ